MQWVDTDALIANMTSVRTAMSSFMKSYIAVRDVVNNFLHQQISIIMSCRRIGKYISPPFAKVY